MFLLCARVQILGKLPIELKGFAFNTEGNLPKELLRRTGSQVSFGVLPYRQKGPGKKRADTVAPSKI